MSNQVTVIDYGINNLLSICRALEHCGATVRVATEGKQIKGSDRLVLPGVGAFPDGMRELNERGLTEGIKAFYAGGNPLLGICLGMQLLMGSGTEIVETPGIGIIDGKVLRLPAAVSGNGHPMKIPHMNWNQVTKPTGASWTKTVLEPIRASDYMYFVHSYYTQLDHPEEVLAQTYFGNFMFTSALRKHNCWATQFHPEKSGENGLKILRKFLMISG